MFSVAVRHHLMIAHSFRGAVFGPAQRLHGATYDVEAEFRRAALDGDGLVCDIGRALDTLRSALAPLDYRNLDELPEFAGRNTTTELLAGELWKRLAAAVRAGELGPGTAETIVSIRVVLRESPIAWASYDAPLG
jgi:6-pyruvoyltetrahydropterin/6-carboxytetrahydropterin synthase